MVAEVE